MNADLTSHLADLQARATQSYQAGDRRQAEQLCWEALRLKPLFAPALYLLGALALDAGRSEQAVLFFHHAALLEPTSADYHSGLGEAYRLRGEGDEALAALGQALRLDPNHAPAQHALGLVHFERGDLEASAAAFRRAIALRPGHERAHLNLGRTLQKQGDLDAAAACYREAIRLRPGYALAHNNLGAVHQAGGRNAEAVACFREALRLQPQYPEALYNLGNSLLQLSDWRGAEAALRAALALRPNHAPTLTALAQAAQRQRRETEAALHYREALRLVPDDAATWCALGNVLKFLADWDGAAEALDRALALQPDSPEVFASRVHTRQMVCDWRGLAADVARLWEETRRRLDEDRAPPLSPSVAWMYPWSPKQLLALARGQARAVARAAAALAQGPLHRIPAAPRDGRLRVGYLSGDFCDHPIGHLTQALFGRHDRDRFEVFAYSFGPDDASSYRLRVARECEHFRDAAGLSSPDLARLIAADGVQVLVDLMGYTGFHRMEVLALRPAPVQASWLGNLGTTGADFFDYLVGDAVVTPPEMAGGYSEKLVNLPGGYLAAEPIPPERGRRLSRRECGLPEGAFVFCSFNNAYKLEPEGFAAWMRILREVHGSVLWLSLNHPSTERNLRREAAAAGVDPGRLVFTGFKSRTEHWSRHTLADLFLDTWYYNAAATATLALDAGVPLLSCPGQTYASRAGASALTAAGLPELIAADREDYVRRAIGFARHPEELRALRERFASTRATCPLLDVGRLARELEQAYLRMWEVYAAGQPVPG